MRVLLILSALAAFGGGSGAVLPSRAAAQPAQAWEIGPVIRGRNLSVGMPFNPAPSGRGWYFSFPYPHQSAGHVHYVTFRPGSLVGKSRLIVRYRVDAAQAVRFVPRERHDEPATVSLYFQRRGDTWSGRRQYEYFRWFAPSQSVRALTPGVHEISVSLQDGNWGSVMGRPAATNRAAFEAALAETDRVGLLFGSPSARGHGVYATGPARFTLVSFRII